MNWLPINTAPKDRFKHKMFAVIAKDDVINSGLYTTNPYYVRPDAHSTQGYNHWPYPFPPTHWHPMPEFEPAL